MEPIIPVNTLIYHGYDFPTAIAEIANLNTQYIELAFMTNYYPGLTEEVFNPQYAHELGAMIEDNGLQSIAFSAHMDLGGAQSAAIFKRRMDFAKEIGSRMIITNTCRSADKLVFLNNIEALIDFAESIDMIIALENPGSGVDTLFESGKSFASILNQMDSAHLVINYDFANTFSYSRSRLLPEEDFPCIQSRVGHIHIKDLRSETWGWSYSEIGQGVINYRDIFRKLRGSAQLPPMSIELPLRFHMDEDSSFVTKNLSPPKQLSEINRILGNSLQFIRDNLGMSGQ